MNPSTPSINDFVNKLVAEKNFGKLESVVLDQIKEDILDGVTDRVNAAIVESMPPDKMDTFEQVLTTGDKAAVDEYCVKNVPDLPEVIAAALLDYRNSYLGR